MNFLSIVLKNNIDIIEKSFSFWCPIEISKASNLDPTTGQELMILGGIASTADEDSDGEFLDPKGFDIEPLKTSGMVNWHHQAKNQPATIVGEPRFAEIRPEGLYIETELYKSSKMAQDVWLLAQTLERDSTTRRLGYSIEGKVTKRKSEDPKHPDFKKVMKAIITGVAITHQPKNPKTFANIIKGEIDDDFEDEEEKSLDTTSGAAIVPESVDGVKPKNKTFNKAECMEQIFRDYAGISVNNAQEIYSIYFKIATMSGRKQITNDDIQKAKEVLGMGVEEADIEKGHDGGSSCAANGGQESKAPAVVAKAKGQPYKTDNDDGDDDSDDSDGDAGDGGGEVSASKKDSMKKADDNTFDAESFFNNIEKAIAEDGLTTREFVRASAILVKDCRDVMNKLIEKADESNDLIKAQGEEILSLRGQLEDMGNTPNLPKSVRSSVKAVERGFDKGEENELEKGGQPERNPNTLSVKRDRRVILDLMDAKTFEKGYDDEMAKAMLSYEADKVLPKNIIARFKAENGIDIVQ